jgi:predicted transcriptional regulator
MKRLARGELEAQVLDALWDADDWLTPAEVLSAVKTRARPLAYTTVMTILARLWAKGMLDRRRQSRGYAYRTVSTREEWAAQRMHDFLETAGNRGAALSHFVDGIDGREAARLRRLLENRRKR